MARKSLQYELLEALNLQTIKNNHTRKAYKNDLKAFATFAKGQGYKSMESLGNGLEVLQEYSYYLQEKYSSPATIHRKLCSPCLALDVNMKDIDKPKRRAKDIIRGRDPEANAQGRAEMQQDRFKRLVTFQEVVGIRRNELAHLEGRDISRDKNGYLTVIVRNGKGGKRQLQRVFPENEHIVKAVFDGIGHNEKVFSRLEMSNCINLHGIRAAVAQEAYKRYELQTQTIEGKKKLLQELRAYYMDLHPYDPKKQKATKDYYCQCWLSMHIKKPPYKLRGDNKKKALAASKPIEYNRLALLAVSVFHLSHWRLDVTITNYLVL